MSRSKIIHRHLFIFIVFLIKVCSFQSVLNHIVFFHPGNSNNSKISLSHNQSGLTGVISLALWSVHHKAAGATNFLLITQGCIWMTNTQVNRLRAAFHFQSDCEVIKTKSRLLAEFPLLAAPLCVCVWCDKLRGGGSGAEMRAQVGCCCCAGHTKFHCSSPAKI